MWPCGKPAQARLEDALAEQPLTAVLGLRVEVTKKVAHVNGTVPSDRYGKLISAIASGIHGIDFVDVSRLVVADPGPEATADAAGQDRQHGRGEGRRHERRHACPRANGAGRQRTGQAGPRPTPGRPAAREQHVDVLQRGSSVVLRGAVDSEAEAARAKAPAAGAT